MKKVDLRVMVVEDNKTSYKGVTGYTIDNCPGLFVYKAEDKTWILSHKSGYAVKRNLVKKTFAISLANRIYPHADWDFDSIDDITDMSRVIPILFPKVQDVVINSASTEKERDYTNNLYEFKKMFGIPMPIDVFINSLDICAFDDWLHKEKGYLESHDGSMYDFLLKVWGKDAVKLIERIIGGEKKPMTKSEQLAEDFGYKSVMECLEDTQNDGSCPGICTNKGCSYSTEVEPDCETGFCENCNTQTVASLLILEGLI